MFSWWLNAMICLGVVSHIDIVDHSYPSPKDWCDEWSELIYICTCRQSHWVTKFIHHLACCWSWIWSIWIGEVCIASSMKQRGSQAVTMLFDHHLLIPVIAYLDNWITNGWQILADLIVQFLANLMFPVIRTKSLYCQCSNSSTLDLQM